MGNFPVVELDENFQLNFLEKQKSITRAPSMTWEKVFCRQGSKDNFSLSDQLKNFGSFLNSNAFEV